MVWNSLCVPMNANMKDMNTCMAKRYWTNLVPFYGLCYSIVHSCLNVWTVQCKKWPRRLITLEINTSLKIITSNRQCTSLSLSSSDPKSFKQINISVVGQNEIQVKMKLTPVVGFSISFVY